MLNLTSGDSSTLAPYPLTCANALGVGMKMIHYPHVSWHSELSPSCFLSIAAISALIRSERSSEPNHSWWESNCWSRLKIDRVKPATVSLLLPFLNQTATVRERKSLSEFTSTDRSCSINLAALRERQYMCNKVRYHLLKQIQETIMGAMGNRSPPQMFLFNPLLQRQELNAAKKWTTMSKISKRVSAITSKQMQFLFFYIIHQLFIHPGL